VGSTKDKLNIVNIYGNSLKSCTTFTKAVFSNKFYLSLAALVAASFWLISNVSNQLLFFFPSLTFYWPIPESSIPSFVLSSIIAGLTGVVVSMTIFTYRHSTDKAGRKNNKNKAAAEPNYHSRPYSFSSLLISGSSSSIGVITSVCSCCSYPASISLFASILGGSGTGMMGAAVGASSGTTTVTMLTSLLSAYQMPLQLASIVLLTLSYYYSASKMLIATAATTSCAVENKDNNHHKGDTNTSAAADNSY